MNDTPHTPSAVGSGGADKRRNRRMRVLMSGYISINGHLSSFPCTIRNMSDGGAMLIFPEVTPVPERFTLYMDLSGFKVDCARVWQDGLSYGVRFTSGKEPFKPVRQQHVLTSETALSQRTRREIELREKQADEERRIAEERAAERRREMAEAVAAGRRAALLGIANGKFGKRN
jgi:hypothetical protein